MRNFSSHMPPLDYKLTTWQKPSKWSMTWSAGDYQMSHSTPTMIKKHPIQNTERTFDARYFWATHQTWHPAACGISSVTWLNTRWSTASWQQLVEFRRTWWKHWVHSTLGITPWTIRKIDWVDIAESATFSSPTPITSSLKSSCYPYSARCLTNNKRTVYNGHQEEWLNDLEKRSTMRKAFIIGAIRIKSQFIVPLLLMGPLVIFFLLTLTRISSGVISSKMQPRSIR